MSSVTTVYVSAEGGEAADVAAGEAAAGYQKEELEEYALLAARSVNRH